MVDYKIFRSVLIIAIASTVVGSCKSGSSTGTSGETLDIGALLPFSGEQAAGGFNMEQALSLAMADVNAGGGVNGRSLRLVSRDSNSGSDAGYTQAKELLYDRKIIYLVGPEEIGLAKKLVPDVKKLDILNLLPGYGAPVIRETGKKGGWLRLAPSPTEVGCAMAIHAVHSGHLTASAIVAADDYQTQVSTDFNSYYASFGGKMLGSMTVKPDSDNFLLQVQSLKSLNAEISILLAYSKTASKIIQEWALIGRKTSWFLPPTLQTEMFLQNIPLGSLNGDVVFSPSISVPDECELENDFGNIITEIDNEPGEVDAGLTDAGLGDVRDTASADTDTDDQYETVKYDMCRRDNITEFAKHYSNYWGGDTPLPASLFYYDAMVLLAMGLTAAEADGVENPTPTEVRAYVRKIAEAPGIAVSWKNIGDALDLIREGKDVSYVGAAAEYQFDGENGKAGYGIAKHKLLDLWSIENSKFTYDKSIVLTCRHL